jgi:hypothetical protein
MRDHLSGREDGYSAGTSGDQENDEEFLPAKNLYTGRSLQDMKSAKNV